MTLAGVAPVDFKVATPLSHKDKKAAQCPFIKFRKLFRNQLLVCSVFSAVPFRAGLAAPYSGDFARASRSQ
jgi:hypothetical protein